MSETAINSIVLDKIPLNSMTLAFMRKLERFGCVIVMDEQGNDKHKKAELAVIDAVDSTETPSVLIITTKKLMYVWYRSLIADIGMDFKFITSEERSINYFSPKLANLYITNEEAGENPIYSKIKDAGLVWDLVIVDGGLSKRGINTDMILDNFDIKTKRLVVFASYLKVERDAAEKLSGIPAKFLANEEQAAYFKEHYPDDSVLDFTLSTPFTRYYGCEPLTTPNIKTITYSLDKSIIKTREERPSSSLYCYGGNIFEELTLDMRKLYISENYDVDAVNELRGYDTKLDAYLKELDRLLEDPDSRIITYFSSEKTLDYIYKVLSSPAVGLDRITAVKKFDLYDMENTLKSFKAGKKDDVRIILSLDDQDEECAEITYISHVINYELPNSPLTLHRRYKQGGTNGFSNPEFIIFRDETNIFDGRMLSAPLALNICDSFSFDIPGRNIYVYTEELEKILADMMCEIENVEDMDDNALADLIVKYNLRTTPDRAKIALCSGRDAIRIAFGLPDGNKFDKQELLKIFGDKINEIRNGCPYFNFNGQLVSKPYEPNKSDDYEEVSSHVDSDPLTLRRNRARELLDGCGSTADCIRLLKDVDENSKNRVYYCAWRYLTENCGLDRDYDKFLEECCEEVV